VKLRTEHPKIAFPSIPERNTLKTSKNTCEPERHIFDGSSHSEHETPLFPLEKNWETFGCSHSTRVARKVKREGEAADLSLPLPLPELPLECECHCLRLPRFRLFHQHSLKGAQSGAERPKTEKGRRNWRSSLQQISLPAPERTDESHQLRQAPASLGSSINRLHFIISVPTGTLRVPSGRTNSTFILITHVFAHPSRTMTERQPHLCVFILL
jgi:hypothetical protein